MLQREVRTRSDSPLGYSQKSQEPFTAAAAVCDIQKLESVLSGRVEIFVGTAASAVSVLQGGPTYKQCIPYAPPHVGALRAIRLLNRSPLALSPLPPRRCSCRRHCCRCRLFPEPSGYNNNDSGGADGRSIVSEAVVASTFLELATQRFHHRHGRPPTHTEENWAFEELLVCMCELQTVPLFSSTSGGKWCVIRGGVVVCCIEQARFPACDVNAISSGI